MKHYLLFLFFMVILFPAFSQKEVAIWHFGKNTGIDFRSGAPVAISNPNMNSWEGCASISDNCTGELLFYTNGVEVWDKNHNRMPNGFGLMGGLGSALSPSSTTQSSIIVPKPGNKNIYYIFTNDCNENNNAAGFRYSIVDMTLNGGLGDITTKNTLLLAPNTEKVTGVHHSNKTDIWVITHGKNNDSYYAYLVTAAGVSAPVISNVGSIMNFATGYLRVSSDGKKISCCHYNNFNQDGFTEVGDFNNSTGIVSNIFKINTNYYGTTFSPDCRFLYLSGSGKLDQFDMTAGNAAAIIASKINVNNQPNYGSAWAMQQAIDGKIYCTIGMSNLHVINNPNSAGTACNVVKRAFNITNTCNMGLTNFVESFFNPDMFLPRGGPPTATISSVGVCVNQPITFSITPSIPVTVDSVRWSFGDIGSGALNTSTDISPEHIYTTPGSYSVSVIRYVDCGPDTTNYQLTIKDISLVSINDTSLCYGDPLVLSANIPGISFMWQNGSTEPYIQVNEPGMYWIEVTDECGTDRDSADVKFEDCEATLFVPNAFLPGTSINNAIFLAKGVNIATFKMQIFDRWGMLIYESNDINKGWDGTFKGTLCQQDVYVWRITYESIATSRENTTGTPRLEQAVGHVSLLR